MEVYGGVSSYEEEYDDPLLQQLALDYQTATYGQPIFRNGWMAPLGAAFIQETTVFREFGPLSGNTIRLAYEASPAEIKYQLVDGDARYYKRLGGTGVAAFRFKGFHSWGDQPSDFYFGGIDTLRGFDYNTLVGNRAAYLNAERRFPLIDYLILPWLRQDERDAALVNHVPENVLLLIFASAFLALGVVGFGSGLAGAQDFGATAALCVLTALLILVVIDLDRPRRGLIRVGQESMLARQASLARPER